MDDVERLAWLERIGHMGPMDLADGLGRLEREARGHGDLAEASERARHESALWNGSRAIEASRDPIAETRSPDEVAAAATGRRRAAYDLSAYWEAVDWMADRAAERADREWVEAALRRRLAHFERRARTAYRPPRQTGLERLLDELRRS